MRTTLIRTTARANTNALAFQGIRPSECFSQIQDTISRNVGEKHAACFAEPVMNRQEGFIDWYVPFGGDVRAYAELSDSEKESASAQFAALAKDIQRYAESLIATQDAQKVTRGNLLLLALLYPQEEDLFLVGGAPVVTCWGFAPGSRGAEGLNLCDLRFVRKEAPITPANPDAEVAAPPNPAQEVVVAQGEQKSSFFFWPWLLPLLLLLLLFALLFADFGPIKSLSGTSLLRFPALFGGPVSPSPNELALDQLEQEIAALETKVIEHMAMCANPKPVTKKEVKKEELVIPENVQDTSFMRGRWLCSTGLFNSVTQEPVQVEFLFDNKGQGIGNIYEQSGVCSGKATAVMQGNVLHIEHDVLICPATKSGYSANAIDCANRAGKTECKGHSKNGDPWNAVFIKLIQ